MDNNSIVWFLSGYLVTCWSQWSLLLNSICFWISYYQFDTGREEQSGILYSFNSIYIHPTNPPKGGPGHIASVIICLVCISIGKGAMPVEDISLILLRQCWHTMAGQLLLSLAIALDMILPKLSTEISVALKVLNFEWLAPFNCKSSRILRHCTDFSY